MKFYVARIISVRSRHLREKGRIRIRVGPKNMQILRIRIPNTAFRVLKIIQRKIKKSQAYLGARRSAVILSAMRAAAVMALLTACRRPTLQLCHPWRLVFRIQMMVLRRSVSDQDPYPDPGGQKRAHKNKIKLRISCFEVLNVLFWGAKGEGFCSSLDVIYGGLGKNCSYVTHGVKYRYFRSR